jgi:hypothetical protein
LQRIRQNDRAKSMRRCGEMRKQARLKIFDHNSNLKLNVADDHVE